MTLLDDLRALVSPIRALRGGMSIQVHRVFSVKKEWSGGELGVGTETVTEEEILESGQPPNVQWVKPEERALGGMPAGTVQIGPITPPYSGGGIDSVLFSDPSLPQGTALYVKLIGDRHPDPGALYITKEIRNGKAFNFLVFAEPVALEGT